MPDSGVGAVKYNMTPRQNYGSDHSGAAVGAVTGNDARTSSVSAENPMLWLVGVGALTLGLVAFSTHVRVGNVSAGVSAGTP